MKRELWLADLRGGNDKESLGNMAGKRKSRAKTTRSILSGHGGGLDALGSFWIVWVYVYASICAHSLIG